MSKYDGITRLLAGRTEDILTLPWTVLDDAVGGLPASARNHVPWWHGDRAQVRAWQAAGYVLDHVQPGVAVTFRRAPAVRSASAAPRPAAAPAGSNPIRPERRQRTVEDAAALSAIDPENAVAVIACSKRKRRDGTPNLNVRDYRRPWSLALRHARDRVATAAERAEERLLPAWQRYTGTFHTQARAALTEAVARQAPLLILSGGYGVLEATEPIGWYERELRPADWPHGLLGREIAGYARRQGVRSVVAFVGASTGYAQVLRDTEWVDLYLDRVLLVTVTPPAGGAQIAVPQDLASAFTAWWHGQPAALPANLRVECLLAPPEVPGPDPALHPSRPSGSDGTADAVAAAAAYLADHANAVAAPEIDARDPRLRSPGLYAWWVDEDGARALSRSLGEEIGPLIYAGQAGATTRRSRLARAATLRSRVVGQHLQAQTRGSTFALTLAAALRTHLNLTFGAPRKIDAASRPVLQQWMRDHLAVATFPVPDPTHLAELEEDVLEELDPPLNLDGRAVTAVRDRLTALRRDTRPGYARDHAGSRSTEHRSQLAETLSHLDVSADDGSVEPFPGDFPP